MSVELAFLAFWLLMTGAGLLIWRSGDRIGGRSVAQIGAISSVGAAGIWLTRVGYPWLGYGLGTCTLCVWLTVIWKADRAILRQMAPMLGLGGAVIAVIWLTEVSSWFGAPREAILALLALLVVLTTAFLVWMLASTFRYLRLDLRAKPTVNSANPPSFPTV
jgi:hypothetical protein